MIRIMGWRTSSYTNPQGSDCVEVAGLPEQVAVRDSKDPDGPRLGFGEAAWASFTKQVKAGSYEL